MKTQSPSEFVSIVNAVSSAISALKPSKRPGRTSELRKLIASVAGDIEARLAQGVSLKDITECISARLGTKLHPSTISRYYTGAIEARGKADREAAERIAREIARKHAARPGEEGTE
jgi:hypothetical protein